MINLVNVVKYYKGLEHQTKALEYLQSTITPAVAAEFQRLWSTPLKPTKISQRGIDLIKSFENLELKAYIDAVGKHTIGYGHTKTAKPGMKITEQQAEQLLNTDLDNFEYYILQFVDVPLTQNQFDALVSFAFNVGEGNFINSTLLRLLNQKKYKEAAEQLKRWVHGKDREVLPGLVRRRQAEYDLFMG